MPGSAARIRVSSVIPPSCIGTLKSTRISTRLPARSTSDMRLKRIAAAELLRVHERNRHVQHAIAEAPLVVVPRRNLDQRAFADLRQRRIKNGAGRIVVEVGGNEQLAAVLQDAL